MQIIIFPMMLIYMFLYLVEIVAAVMVVTTTVTATKYLLWSRHCAQQALCIISIIPKLHKNEVVLFLVLELEKLSFREAKRPGLVDWCPGLSRSVSPEVWSQPVGSALPGNLTEVWAWPQTCWFRNSGTGASLVFLLHSEVWEPLFCIHWSHMLFQFTLIITLHVRWNYLPIYERNESQVACPWS